jgi:hypothetical protein
LILPQEHPDVLAYLCRRQSDKVLVLLNWSKEKASFTIDHPAIAGDYHHLFTSETTSISRQKSFTFEPGAFEVYHVTSSYP